MTRRLWRYAAQVAVLMAAATVATLVLWPNADWRDGSRHGHWISVFDGFGHTSANGSGAGQTITLFPAAARTSKDTHSALVVTETHYQDFVASVRVRTETQLRRGAAGSPNPWEVGWVIWHFSSNKRFYALTLGPTGWVLSKQDPAYPGGQRFLATGKNHRFAVGVTHRVGIVQIGNRITVSGDGQLLAHFTDTSEPYLAGSFGVYTEDSRASFGQIKINPLPRIAS